jgi:4-amino-4-deoxychorismate mutase
MNTQDPLQDLRKQLDDLDHQLLALLGQRFEICRQVAQRKTQFAIPLMQPGRVKIVQDRAIAAAREHGFGEAFALDLYQRIIAEACRLEDELMGGHQPVTQSN